VDPVLAAAAASPLFSAVRTPYILLDRRFHICGVNSAYLTATGRTRDELLGVQVFEAFPDNPDDPHADGVRNLRASLEWVLRHGRAHDMLIQRYDIRQPGPAGTFRKKVWLPVNSPVTDQAGRIAGLLHHVEDITEVAELLPYMSGGEKQALAEQPAGRLVVAAALATTRYRRAQAHLAEENRHLRDALMTLAASRQPGTRAAERRRLLRQAIDDIGAPTWAGSACAAAARIARPEAAAALTLRPEAGPGREYQLAATGPWARDLEDLQYTTGEGPCLGAFYSGIPVLVPDLSAEAARWPGFTEATAGSGLAAAFAFPLLISGEPVGTLTVYSRRRGHLRAQQLADIAILTDIATTALLADLDSEPNGQVVLPASLQAVNMAAGMIAAQLHIPVDQALSRLRGHAFAHNQSVVETAQAILAGRLRLEEH
jgi:hypothetical protein